MTAAPLDLTAKRNRFRGRGRKRARKEIKADTLAAYMEDRANTDIPAAELSAVCSNFVEILAVVRRRGVVVHPIEVGRGRSNHQTFYRLVTG